MIYRETASNPARGEDLFHLTVGFRLRLAILMLGGGMLVMFLIGGSRFSFMWVVLGGATNYISDPALSYLSGRLQFGLVGAIVTAQRLIPLVMLVALAGWTSDILPGACYFVGATTTSLYALGAAGLQRRRLGFDRKAVFQALHVSWPLAALSLGEALAIRITTLLLGLLRGAALAGVYTPIASLTYGAASLAMAAFQPLIPVLADRDMPSISRSIVRFSVVLFVGFSLAAVLAQVVLESGYVLVFGSQPSGQVLRAFRLLVVGLVPWIMSVWFIMHMQVLRDYRAVLWPSLIGTFALVVTGVPLVSVYGIVGAAIASLLGDTLRMIFAGGWLIRSARRAHT
jgi:O-antigen/teichoic acid export membrane protein